MSSLECLVRCLHQHIILVILSSSSFFFRSELRGITQIGDEDVFITENEQTEAKKKGRKMSSERGRGRVLGCLFPVDIL